MAKCTYSGSSVPYTSLQDHRLYSKHAKPYMVNGNIYGHGGKTVFYPLGNSKNDIKSFPIEIPKWQNANCTSYELQDLVPINAFACFAQ